MLWNITRSSIIIKLSGKFVVQKEGKMMKKKKKNEDDDDDDEDQKSQS